MTTSISDLEKLLAEANFPQQDIRPMTFSCYGWSIAASDALYFLVNAAPQLLAIAKAAKDADLNCSSLSLKDCGICPECRLMAAVEAMG